MALNLTPLRWDWASITQGDTFPATNITESEHDSNLTRVRIKIRPSGQSTALMILDSSTSGIVINNAATWDFTISPISTSSLSSGFYSYDLETTDALGIIRTEFNGTWEILDQITD